ncbi:MAG: hypothetical protein ACREQM_22445 [Candidatus Dormibacteraceae bacterium]
MILDILIVLAVAVAVFIGYKRGTVQPAFALAALVLVLLILVGHWEGYSTALDQHFHSNGAIDGIVIVLLAILAGYGGWRLGGFVHKMPIIRGADGLLGVLICGLIAIWLLYGLISLATSLGQAFDGTLGQTASAPTTPAQAQAINTWVEGNPVLRMIVTEQDLQGLEKAAKTPNNPASAISNFSSLLQLQTVYRDLCQPQLESSHLAPVVMWIGDHTPIVGHEGPAALPRKPSPSPSPSPSGSPAPAPTPTP